MLSFWSSLVDIECMLSLRTMKPSKKSLLGLGVCFTLLSLSTHFSYFAKLQISIEGYCPGKGELLLGNWMNS
jgi:hypothetical protein